VGRGSKNPSGFLEGTDDIKVLTNLGIKIKGHKEQKNSE